MPPLLFGSIWALVSAEREMLCGTVLATTRNFQIKSPSVSGHSGMVR